MTVCSKERRHTALPAHIFRFALVVIVLCAGLAAQAAFGQTLESIVVAQIYNDKRSSSTLGVGEPRQFTATGKYSDNSQRYITQQVTWTSENTTVATVTPNMGLVIGVAPGTVNIDATLNGITGKSSLTVKDRTLKSVAITPPFSWAMQKGKSQQFNATAEYGASIQDVTGSATWSSSTPAVATVSSTGSVTAVAAGTTTITATLSNIKGSTTLTVSSTAAPNLGQWTAPQSLGMRAIHAVMLHTGKVLFWGYPIGRHGGPSPARLYDPVENTVTDVTIPWGFDIFCSGQLIMKDGRVFVDGGTDDGNDPGDSGIANTTIFDPSTNTWSQGPNMTYARWYPTVLELPNGTILAASGNDQNGVTVKAMESYDPNTSTWKVLPTSANIPNPVDLYPLFTLLANGKVFFAAPRSNSIMFNLETNAWSTVANLNLGPRHHAADVLLPGGHKVMVVGGALMKADGGGNPTNTTEIIDFTRRTPVWTYGAPLNIARYNDNLIYLADGSLLAVGGGQHGSYGKPVFQPESYSFSTGKWTLMAPQNAVRSYHSTAVLLPDGRVVSAGSDSGGALEHTYEIYSPPYLYQGPRPKITFSPKSIIYSKQFTIETPDASTIKSVGLIRPGATTHANHMDDHRFVYLSFTASSGRLTVTAPSNPINAPPGYYMLVIINANGVPSVMPFVQVQ